MARKYIIALTLIIAMVFLSITIGIGYLYFDKIVEEKDFATVVVDGDLSYNFMNGQIIDLTNSNHYSFSVTNTSLTPYYYNLTLEDVKADENVNFELQSNREGFQTISKRLGNGTYNYAGTIKINGGETHSYTFQLLNHENKTISGKLTVNLEKDMNTFANVILKNNIINEKSITNLGDVSQDEEGLIESSDDLGGCYYFRGNVNNNYVEFANLTWRIVKINGDGSVKLVLNDLINNSTQFYKEDYDLNFENSNAFQILSNWYQGALKEYDSLIATHRFCTDATNGEKGYSSLTRIYTNKDPIFQCLGFTTTSKIGLLTADEISFAGGSDKSLNEKFYLYNDSIKNGWWTMSPAKNTDGSISFIEVNKNGIMNSGTTGSLFRGSRPVINIIKKATVSGSGKIDDPYIVNLT